MAEPEEALEKAVRVAKIGLSSAEIRTMEKELASFLDWLKPLHDAKKLSSDSKKAEIIKCRALREDEALNAELSELRKAAPRFNEGFYQVPPIIE